MKPSTHPAARRLGAAIGVLGVTTLAAGTQAAPAVNNPNQTPDKRRQAEAVLARLIAHTSPLTRAPILNSARKHLVANRGIPAILQMVAAGNRIARLPYVYGGGHGSFSASGYDCSGSVSFVLHAAGLLSTPLDSTGLESFGESGPGKHVTIYANSTHAWMTINGRRFDTTAFQEAGSRWSSASASASGYITRHPRGL